MAWLLPALALGVAFAWLRIEHTAVGAAISWAVAVAILVGLMAVLVLAMAAGARLVQ